MRVLIISLLFLLVVTSISSQIRYRNGIQDYATVAALRAESTITARDYDKVYVKETNGIYVHDKLDVSSADDGVNVIVQTAGSKRWKCIDCGAGGGGTGDSVRVVANYTALRALDDYAHGVVVVRDWTYTGPDGNSYTTLGGIFKKVSTGSENGGTVIVGNYIWAREWDRIHVQPEWWEVGGYDYKGEFFTNKNTSSGIFTAAPKGVYNETDRCNSAANVADDGGVIVFYKNKEYVLDGRMEIKVGQTLYGNNCTLKRINTPTSLVTANATTGATSVTVADASGFRAGQVIMFTNPAATNGGVAHGENVGIIDYHRITSISGNVISFTNGIGANVNIGYRAIISFTLINAVHGLNEELLSIQSINFDGNVAGNPYCYDWRYGACISLSSASYQSKITNCSFKNTPAENIFGTAVQLNNCTYSELNGSLLHISADANREAVNTITLCSGKGSNRATNAIMNHSEALITSSANSTNVRLSDCNFEDGDEQIFTLDSNDDFDWIVHNSAFKNFKYVVFALSGGGVASIKKLRINNNTFDNCGPINILAASPSSIYKGTSLSEVTINDNDFTNCRLQFNHTGKITISSNKFYWNNEDSTKYDYSTNTLNAQSAFNQFINFDRLHIINNTFEYPNVYNSATQFGLMLLHNNIVRKTSAGADTDYLYSQDVKVNGNTFAGFKYGICTSNTASPQFLNLTKQAVGWEYKNNIIYMARNTGSNNGTGIFVDPGVVCEGNTIYTNAVVPCYAGIIAAGVGTAGSAHNRLIGAICINNKVLGCASATAADIVANADGTRYNVTCINNMTRDDIFNATNGYFTGNYKLTTALYPQLSAMTCPEWRYYGEDAGQY